MPIEWTGLGPELLLRLDRSRPEPLRSQLERELRDAIRAGRLEAGERLPSSRNLAAELGLSRGLVTESYRQLESEGYLSARGGSATRVAAGAAAAAAAEPPPAAGAPRLAVDFLAGVPDLGSFPRRDWAWAVRESCRDVAAPDLGYTDPRGQLALRDVLAAYLRRVRGGVAGAERIVVCAGFAQGQRLVLRAHAREGGRRVAVEDPGDVTYLAGVIGRMGLEIVPVPVDERGIDVAALAASGADAVILTPAHQSPTGVVLAAERRQALVALAAERGLVILEDDYDAEFRYDRDPVGALHGLALDHVAGLGSVSKSLAPGLRLGWVVCPPRLVAAVAAEKQLDDRGSPVLDQLALARLIESGRYDRHLRRMRGAYGRKRAALVAALAEHAPEVSLHGLAAGFHAVARLPAGVDEEAVVAQARERSIGVYGMSASRSSGAAEPAELVLGFGNLSEDAIRRGIAGIADLLRPR
jgi:GntR family transcriptional regulator/MocR family aminotransferase